MATKAGTLPRGVAMERPRTAVGRRSRIGRALVRAIGRDRDRSEVAGWNTRVEIGRETGARC